MKTEGFEANGRRNVVLILETPGRDQGKMFKLVEMDAFTGEWWAIRAFLLLSQRGGMEVAEEGTPGWAALAAAGYQGMMKLNPFELKPLLDEMMPYMLVIPDKTKPDLVRNINPALGDVQEIWTLLELRKAWWELHVGFSLPDAPSPGQASGPPPAPSM